MHSLQIKTCDQRLLNIAVPDVMSVYMYNSCTGSELQAWTHYFSLPVLKGILPIVYLRHWSLVVGSLQIRSSDCITPHELATATTLLKEFYEKFPELYGIYP